MDDINSRLDALLSDPDIASKLNGILSGLTEEKAEEKKENDFPDLSSLLKNVDLGDALSLLNGFSGGKDDGSQLLCALKPYLRESRQKRIDEAEKLMSLYRLLPLLTKFSDSKNQ